jgi:FkbM family methyltransferase
MISIFNKYRNPSYAQSGEDRIISFLFDWLKIKSPTYLDVGAHHSKWLSNTYLFYKNGSRGVCVEPDPHLYAAIKRARPRDTCLNVGIGQGDQDQADFYVMTSKSLNTFSKEDALRCQNTLNFGEQKIEKVIQVPLRTINSVMTEYFSEGVNLLSLDVEGLDFEIVQSFDFSKFQPDVFCIETLRFQENGELKKSIELINFMLDKNYFIYGETYINTIFISSKLKKMLS